jgi:hypothetical protein
LFPSFNTRREGKKKSIPDQNKGRNQEELDLPLKGTMLNNTISAALLTVAGELIRAWSKREATRRRTPPNRKSIFAPA